MDLTTGKIVLNFPNSFKQLTKIINTYINRLNRQFRVEERDSKGDVHGKYGYFDRKGKFRVVKYSSTAKDGFRVHS